jgi:hypothetical protein
MQRVTITLTESVRRPLWALAQREHRPPKEQILALLEAAVGEPEATVRRVLDLVEERDRYRAALEAVYEWRLESTDQPAHIAWHILTVDLPDVVGRALRKPKWREAASRIATSLASPAENG